MSNIKYPVDSPHSFLKEDIYKELAANFETGLSANEVSERQMTFGKNPFEQKKRIHHLLIFNAQFIFKFGKLATYLLFIFSYINPICVIVAFKKK